MAKTLAQARSPSRVAHPSARMGGGQVPRRPIHPRVAHPSARMGGGQVQRISIQVQKTSTTEPSSNLPDPVNPPIAEANGRATPLAAGDNFLKPRIVQPCSGFDLVKKARVTGQEKNHLAGLISL